MAEVSNATLDAGLKYWYLNVFRDQTNMQTSPLYAKIKKQEFSGKKIVVPIKYGVSGGISTADDNSAFPEAGGVNVKDFEGDAKNLFGIIQLTDKVIKASRDSRGAFKSAINLEMEHITKSLKKNVNRQLFGDGTGIITQVDHGGGYVASASFVVDDAANLEIGMIIDILNHDTHAVEADAVRITNIVRSTNTVHVATADAVTVSDNADIVIQDSYNKEITGLGCVFSSSNIYWNLARTSYGFLIPTMTDLTDAGQPQVITQVALQDGMDEMFDTWGTTCDFIICSRGVRNSIMEMLQTFVQNLQFMTLNGGFRSIKYNDVDIYHDKNMPAGTLYMLDSSTLTEWNMGDWDWARGDNGSVLRMLPTSPVRQAVLMKYCDVLCDVPGGQTKINGIKENDGVA